MKIEELAVQYRESGEKCRRRHEELMQILRSEPMSETERLILRRRAYMIAAMAREAIATANYLSNYYGRKNDVDDSDYEDERICA